MVIIVSMNAFNQILDRFLLSVCLSEICVEVIELKLTIQ